MPNVTKLRVNGVQRRLDADPERPLLSVLREDLELTGARYGCGEGQCGACTVLADNFPIRSCITPVGAAAVKTITTVEGLEKNGKLDPLQQTFLDEGALQCGYCTSGMLMSAAALLRRNPRPTEAEIVHAMEGNICRCGTYHRIVAAIQRAAGINKGVKP
jgi:aerobic-type carbon monoxide dehydrogenase small subunit (CoxS/CutS family)